MRYHVTTPPVAQPMATVDCVYVIYLGNSTWRVVDDNRRYNTHDFRGLVLGAKIPIPMDALFAIGAGYIRADELQYPETLVAMISLCNA